jgi:hypothetical protein
MVGGEFFGCCADFCGHLCELFQRRVDAHQGELTLYDE